MGTNSTPPHTSAARPQSFLSRTIRFIIFFDMNVPKRRISALIHAGVSRQRKSFILTGATPIVSRSSLTLSFIGTSVMPFQNESCARFSTMTQPFCCALASYITACMNHVSARSDCSAGSVLNASLSSLPRSIHHTSRSVASYDAWIVHTLSGSTTDAPESGGSTRSSPVDSIQSAYASRRRKAFETLVIWPSPPSFSPGVSGSSSLPTRAHARKAISVSSSDMPNCACGLVRNSHLAEPFLPDALAASTSFHSSVSATPLIFAIGSSTSPLTVLPSDIFIV